MLNAKQKGKNWKKNRRWKLWTILFILFSFIFFLSCFSSVSDGILSSTKKIHLLIFVLFCVRLICEIFLSHLLFSFGDFSLLLCFVCVCVWQRVFCSISSLSFSVNTRVGRECIDLWFYAGSFSGFSHIWNQMCALEQDTGVARLVPTSFDRHIDNRCDLIRCA